MSGTITITATLTPSISTNTITATVAPSEAPITWGQTPLSTGGSIAVQIYVYGFITATVLLGIWVFVFCTFVRPPRRKARKEALADLEKHLRVELGGGHSHSFALSSPLGSPASGTSSASISPMHTPRISNDSSPYTKDAQWASDSTVNSSKATMSKVGKSRRS